MDEDSRVDGQPAGFAQPVVAPLGGYASATLTMIADAPPMPPQAFAVDGDPGPRLDQVVPAPPERRDPSRPFEAGQGELMPDAVQRDPRQPIVTASFAGTGPEFAPPTGEPVGKWAPPSGQPVPVGAPVPWGAPGGMPVPWGASVPMPPPHPGDRSVSAIARSGAGAMPYQSSMPPAPAYRGPYVAAPTRSNIQSQYQATSDGLAKFGIVLLAVPWYVLVILIAGVFPLGSWSVLLLVLAWIICTSQSKIAQMALNRCFVVAAIVTTLFWFVAWMSGNYAMIGAYNAILRWSCAILVIVLPLVAWRALERRQ